MAAHEVIDPYFLLYSSACWNGLALGTIDIAKKHVTRTEHADSGLRVADYPIIQVRDHVLLTMLVQSVQSLLSDFFISSALLFAANLKETTTICRSRLSLYSASRVRSTIQIWVVTSDQYEISALISPTSFRGKTQCRLFSQACRKLHNKK